MLNVFRVYGRAAGQAGRLAVKAWPLAVALPLYAGLIVAVLIIASRFGLFGGIAAGFGIAAVSSSYLHLLALAVAGRRITGTDLKESFGARIWDVVSVMFAFFIINTLVGMMVGGMPKGAIIATLVALAMAVFFNPVPELLYQGSSRSFGLLAEAARFISAHGLEWLFPNILFGVLVLLPTGMLQGAEMGARMVSLARLFSIDGLTLVILGLPRLYAPFILIFLHWAMIFRGLLFQALLTGSRREQSVRDVWGKR